MKNTFPFLLLAALFSFGCQKDTSNDNTPTTPTNTDIMVQQAWKFNNAGADLDKNGTIDTDISSQLQSCSTDNTVTFVKDGTGVLDEGATKCSTTAPQTQAFTWSFANNETALNLAGNAVVGISGQFKILALDATKLSLSKDTTLVGVPVALIVNFKH